jgi:Uma2 family endonuclease
VQIALALYSHQIPEIDRMALQTLPRYTFDDYLAVERKAIDEKHEYVAGRVYAMTGASYNHNLIVANLSRRLGNQLEARPCSVLTNDMRVRIETADACKYPDVVTLCEEPQFYDDRCDVLLNPILVIEVLSPSTEAYDRGGKFAVYRALPCLREYVLVAQDRFSVEVFTRQPDDRWLLTAYSTPEDEVVFDSIRCQIALREIYDKVQIAAPDALDDHSSV